VVAEKENKKHGCGDDGCLWTPEKKVEEQIAHLRSITAVPRLLGREETSPKGRFGRSARVRARVWENMKKGLELCPINSTKKENKRKGREKKAQNLKIPFRTTGLDEPQKPKKDTHPIARSKKRKFAIGDSCNNSGKLMGRNEEKIPERRNNIPKRKLGCRAKKETRQRKRTLTGLHLGGKRRANGMGGNTAPKKKKNAGSNDKGNY